jgi:hypothetical protein
MGKALAMISKAKMFSAPISQLFGPLISAVAND